MGYRDMKSLHRQGYLTEDELAQAELASEFISHLVNLADTRYEIARGVTDATEEYVSATANEYREALRKSL